MAIVDVGNTLTATNGTSFTLPGAPAAGNTLVLVAGSFVNSNPLTAVTGGGGSWTQAETNGGSGSGTIDCWYLIGTSGGAGAQAISITVTNAGNAWTTIKEFSGVGSLDQALPFSGFVDPGLTITPATSGELFIAGMESASAFSFDSPLLEFGGFNTATSQFMDAGFYIGTDASPVAIGWTPSGVGSGGWGVAFKPLAAPPPQPHIDFTVSL